MKNEEMKSQFESIKFSIQENYELFVLLKILHLMEKIEY